MELVHDEVFLAAFAKLNPEQQLAVTTVDGPVMVIAGPGTGKTQILTLRIAEILRRTDTAPESILALTFTKSGAKAMRERLRAFIGATAYRVPIFTFHALAERLIRDYPEAYTTIIGGKAATEIEKITFIETILEQPDLVVLRPHGDPSFYVRPILGTISTMKQENVRPDNLATIIAELETSLLDIEQFHEKGAHKGKERGEYSKAVTRIEKLRALLLVYRLYEAMMREKKRYDFDDMILETVNVLRAREDIRLALQEVYQYVLADEHQDVNGAQNEILTHLTSYHENPNIFVVGDEKQAIYRFQGASLENFLYFVEHYPGTQMIALTNNYRSTQAILDQSHDLVAVPEGHQLSPYRVALTAHKEAPYTPKLHVYPHEGFEDEAIKKRVEVALSVGVEPEEIAVIVRSNREVESITTLLRRADIAVRPSADSDILAHPLFAAVLDLIEVVVRPRDEALLVRVFMAPYWQLPLSDIATVMGNVSYAQPLSKLLEDASELTLAEPERVAKVYAVLTQIRAELLTTAPHRLLATLLTEAGLLEYAATADPLSSTHVVRRIYDEVEALVVSAEVVTLDAVVTLFRQRMAYGVALNAPLLSDSAKAVQVMTAHKSKGLEFEVVIIPHLSDAVWGTSKRPDYFKVPLIRTSDGEHEALEDERRLLYVAMTRAKRELYLSYAATNGEGKELSPSPLLDSLPTADVVAETDLITPSLIATHTKTDLARIFVPYIEKSLKDRGLSATSLNNCIKNPWNFLYRNVIRLPEVQNTPMQFGTAMHSVFEYATKSFTQTQSLPAFSDLRSRLERALGVLPLSSVEFTNLFARGQEVIATYIPHLQSTLSAATREELSVKVMLPLPLSTMPELLLTGKLDRIDIDANGKAVRVVDYKTGKGKTRNDIEGKTAKADAGYRRQLSFYSLLLHLLDDERYLTEVGVLSFIEADGKGKIHDEAYESGEAERSLLIEEIAQAVELLLSGEFLHDEVLLADSEYEHLGQALLRRAL